MFATILSAVATAAVSLFLGQAILRLCGFRRWSWIAPAVGISAAMLISVAAIHAPGHCVVVGVILALLTACAIVWCWRLPEHRPPLAGLSAAAPVAVMALVPYLAVGRAGIPGVSLNNDMSMHLLWAEGVLSPEVAAVNPLPADYPIGPHAMAAVLAKGFGIGIDHSFAGWGMAMPVINAWIALAFVRHAGWLGKVLTATVVGMPFLIAAYYGEAAFKEVILAGLILAVVAFLMEARPTASIGRWVPLAFLFGGVLSVYSLAGLPWPLLISAAWVAVLAAGCLARSGFGSLAAAARREFPAIAVAAAAFLVLIVPQIPRLIHFVSLRSSVNGTGIQVGDLGNLVGPLPGWEAFGVWNNPDFRLPSSPAFTGGMWTAFVLGLVLLGALWAFRRGRWLLPLAASLAMLIWVASEHSQSPYVTAKALVIASPLLLALAVLPLAEREPSQESWRFLAPVLALLLIGAVTWSDLRALRTSPVGPTDHVSELRSLRDEIEGKPTLFIGNDDFIQWELASAPVAAPVMQGTQRMPIPPQKGWTSGQTLDFDSIEDATLNAYTWIVAPTDPAASAPPPQLRLVRETDDYSLWRRVGIVTDRKILDEGEMPGKTLRCHSSEGRRIVAAGGTAAIRPEPVVVPGTAIPSGQTVTVELPLSPGKWELGAQYTSPLPVDVAGLGLQTTLSPNLDRPGARWRMGVVRVSKSGSRTLSFHTDATPFTPGSDLASVAQLTATPAEEVERIVPLQRACGRYVDWYRPSGN